jgi:WD40 repeat protein
MSSGIFEITHDSLAAKIWEKVSAEEKTLMEVKNFITTSAAMNKRRKVLLTKEDLAYIAPYEEKLILDNETQLIINRSKRVYRNRRFSTIGVVALIMALMAVGIIVTKNATTKAIAEREKAEAAEATALEEKKKVEQAEKVAVMEKENALKETEKALKAEEIAIVEKQNALVEKKKAELATTDAEKNEKIAQLALINAKASEDEAKDAKTKISKQESDTRNTLDNTKQLAENPTLALNNAVLLYDSVKASELKNQLKRNAFAAYNGIIYTREKLFNRSSREIKDIAVSYDNKSILIVDGTNVLKVWNIETNAINYLKGHLGEVVSVAAAPDRAHFVSVEKGGKLIFWNNNYEYSDTADFKDEVTGIKYINAGRELLIGFGNGDMAIKNLKDKKTKLIHDDKIIDLVELIVPEQADHIFVTRSSDDKIILWNDKRTTEGTGQIENTVIFDGTKSNWNIISMAVSPDGNRLSLATGKGIYLADSLSSGRIPKFRFEINFPSFTITKIIFKDNNEIIASTDGGSCFIYNTEKKEYKEVKGHLANTKISQIKKFGDKRYFVTAGADYSLKIWDSNISNALFFRSVEGNPDKITDPAFTSGKEYYTWKPKNISDYVINFKKKELKPIGTSYTYFVTWDSISNNYDSIRIFSKIERRFDINFCESVIIRDGKEERIIKITDIFGASDKKIRNIVDIKSVLVSECQRFILLKCTGRSGSSYYFIYPTFQGLHDMVANKKLIK